MISPWRRRTLRRWSKGRRSHARVRPVVDIMHERMANLARVVGSIDALVLRDLELIGWNAGWRGTPLRTKLDQIEDERWQR